MPSSRPLGLSAAVVLIAMLMFVAVQREASAVAYVSAGTGPWSAATTWAPAGVPGVGDTVTIEAGHTVTVTTPPTVALPRRPQRHRPRRPRRLRHPRVPGRPRRPSTR